MKSVLRLSLGVLLPLIATLAFAPMADAQQAAPAAPAAAPKPKKPPKPKPIKTTVACEKCGNPMLLRDSKRGPFLGCSTFPTCRHTRALQVTTGRQAVTGSASPQDRRRSSRPPF